MTTPDQQTRRRFLRRSGTALTVVGGAGLASTSAAAQSETDSPPQGLLASGLDIEGGNLWAFLRGFQSARQSQLASKTSVENLAGNMRNEFKANEENWISYGNWLISEHDVEPMGSTTLAVDVVETNMGRDDERVETTIQADYDDMLEEFTAIDWQIEAVEDPDYQVGIKDTHARLASDDLMEFRRNNIDESGEGNHTLPDGEYVEELKGRYWDGLMWGEDSKGIIEILVSEVQ